MITKTEDPPKEITWLINLRWIAVLGQSIVVLSVSKMLVDSVAFFGLGCTILVIAVSNLLLTLGKHRVEKIQLGLILIFDVSALTLLLYFSGGASNPFGLFYLLHVALAAVLLGTGWTWALAVVSSLCYGILFFYSIEVPQLSHHHNHGISSFSLHLQGMWVAFTLAAMTLAFFFTRIIKALRQKDAELKEAEIKSLRAERLASVTALAATAAHEINTPLATIKLAAQEMVKNLNKGGQNTKFLTDAQLILSEVTRCSQTLEKLRGQTGSVEGQHAEEISVEDLVQSAQGNLNGFADRVKLTERALDLSVRAPKNPLAQVLGALIKNGLESANNSLVTIDVERTGSQQIISVSDNGAGIPHQIQNKVGEPFFTTKEPGSGLGLGLFLARSFTEALGGTLNILSKEGAGTKIVLTLPT